MAYKIRIGGLSATATQSTIESMFSSFSPVVATEFEDEGPEVQGYQVARVVIVTLEDVAGGERAVRELDGTVVDAKALTLCPADASG